MNSNQTMALLMLGVESTDGENSVGHAYLAGMKFDISKLKLCKTASDKENCLLTKRNSYGQLIPELYSCSFYPGGQLRDDQRDIRRVDRMYFKKEPSFGGDEFITKIVKSELIDELFVGTETQYPKLYLDRKQFRYNLFLNNCVAFAAQTFEKYAQISLENSTEVFSRKVYFPNVLADSIRRYKKADRYEQEARFRSRVYYESEQFNKDIDLYNEASLLDRFKALESQ